MAGQPPSGSEQGYPVSIYLSVLSPDPSANPTFLSSWALGRQLFLPQVVLLAAACSDMYDDVLFIQKINQCIFEHWCYVFVNGNVLLIIHILSDSKST